MTSQSQRYINSCNHGALWAKSGTVGKPLLMCSRLRLVFPPFHFQNDGWWIKNEHIIVMALGNILLTQGLQKQLNYFGQSSVLMFDSEWRDRNSIFSFIRWWQHLFGEKTFSYSKFTKGTVFPFLKVMSISLRFWTANFCSLFIFTEHIKYDFFFHADENF